MNIIDIKDKMHAEYVLSIIAYSCYMPTHEKMHCLADRYEADEDVLAFACLDKGLILGVIVLKQTTRGKLEILRIATDPQYRKQGIASRLISFVTVSQNCKMLIAETDDDAVGFYRKYGFDIESLGEKYPGTVRYLCTLNM